MKKLLVNLLLVFMLVLTGCAGKQTDIQKNMVPDLSLKDYTGISQSLHGFIGQPLVINSWASWCPFCVEELTDFNVLQNEYNNQLKVIAVNRQQNQQEAIQFIQGLHLDSSIIFLLDEDDSFYKSIQGFSMPETIFVSARGEIVYHKRGVMTLTEMRQRVNSLLYE